MIAQKSTKFKYLSRSREWIYIDFSSDNLGMKFSEWETVKTHSPLLQYTGIKDKHDFEIYEGDIVQLEHWNPQIYIVDFNRGGFCFYEKKEDTYYNDCKYLEKCEIIGNIYLPELLK